MSTPSRAGEQNLVPNAFRYQAKPDARGGETLMNLTDHLRSDRVTRIALMFLDRYDGVHLKDILVDSMGDGRMMVVNGNSVINFGSDSFLGLDRDEHVQGAIVAAMDDWGTHNGASRAFSNAGICEIAEQRLAQWLEVDDTLIFPSVTLANAGLLPALVTKDDLLIVDRQSHDSIQQASKIAVADGIKLRELHPSDPEALRCLLQQEEYERCLIAIDGVYSMSGAIPPLAELYEVAREHGATLYIDDAHGTGVVGPGGRGAAYQALGNLNDVLMVGSLSKAFSCMGAFVTCPPELKRLLKIRSSSFLFGGPVPPPYLGGICAVCDILESDEFQLRLDWLHGLIRRLSEGIEQIGLKVLGGEAPIVSVMIGDIELTLEAGKWLFDQGFYVQSATYPAVPITGGLVRIQVNANHTQEQIDSLLHALTQLKSAFNL